MKLEIDITDEYGDWFAICCVLANTFGEEGRELFHLVGQFYPGYTIEASNSKFDACLRHQYNFGKLKFFEIAKKYGVQ